MRLAQRVCAGLFVTLGLQLPVLASFHFAEIVEINLGTATDPTAQYIVIMPHSDFQNLFSGVEIKVFDSAGNALPNFAIIGANLPSTSTNQQSILVATASAQTVHGVVPDALATGALPQDGLICFKKGPQVPDCVSYGGYAGLTNVGGSEAGPPAPAPPDGSVLRRDISANNPSLLEALDDTDRSVDDFFVTGPGLQNFAGAKTSVLSVSGNVTLSWVNGTAANYTIHKTGDCSTTRGSPLVEITSLTSWPDPNPGLFPGLTCYIVKP